MEEPFAMPFAVFYSIRQDRAKAYKAFKSKYGDATFKTFVAPRIKKNIMLIFRGQPDKYRMFYASTLATIVNQRLGRMPA